MKVPSSKREGGRRVSFDPEAVMTKRGKLTAEYSEKGGNGTANPTVDGTGERQWTRMDWKGGTWRRLRCFGNGSGKVGNGSETPRNTSETVGCG